VLRKRDKADIVAIANRFALALGCAEPPGLPKSTIGKMHLQKVPGVRVQKEEVPEARKRVRSV
jgi:hypothetical protein